MISLTGISAQNHRWWVHIRTASMRQVHRAPKMNVQQWNKKFKASLILMTSRNITQCIHACDEFMCFALQIFLMGSSEIWKKKIVKIYDWNEVTWRYHHIRKLQIAHTKGVTRRVLSIPMPWTNLNHSISFSACFALMYINWTCLRIRKMYAAEKFMYCPIFMKAAC